MIYRIRNIVLFICLFCFLACNNYHPKTKREYRAWFANEDNGFLKKKQIGYLQFNVQYRPIDYMLLNELEEDKSYDKNQIDTLRKSYGSSKYFLLEVGIDDEDMTINEDMTRLMINNYKEFQELITTLAFDMKSKVSLQLGEDTYEPSIYHFERGYELGYKQRFVFAFAIPSESDKSEFTFVFDDDLFDSGINKFKFEALSNIIPSLPIEIS